MKEALGTSGVKPQIVRFAVEAIYGSSAEEMLTIQCGPVFDPHTGSYSCRNGTLLTNGEPNGSSCWFEYYPHLQQGVVGIYRDVRQSQEDHDDGSHRLDYSSLY